VLADNVDVIDKAAINFLPKYKSVLF
jgi:hypothetical protein